MAVVLSVLLLLSSSVPAAEAPREQASPREMNSLITQLLGGLNDPDPGAIWRISSELAALGPGSTQALAARAARADEVQKLAIGRALCLAGEPGLGGRLVLELTRGGSTAEIRMHAARVISATRALHGLEPVMEALLIVLEDEADPLAKTAMADALLRAAAGEPMSYVQPPDFGMMQRSQDFAVSELQRLLRSANRVAAREAALVLGENGFGDLAREELAAISLEPTADGRRALSIVRSPRSQWMQLLEELATRIEDAYVDEDRVDRKSLFEAAAKGMVESLDDFSTYLTSDEVRSMDEMLTGAYEGIGAWVGLRDGKFTIISPVYDGPAYRVGIRSMDVVVEVDGLLTDDLGFETTIKHLKGPSGSTVKVKVSRRGWSEPHIFTITREEIRIQNTYQTMLPGGIGYLRLTRFGDDSGAEVRRAVRSLTAQGAKALIFDLRDNGGGLLSASVDVADCFLGPERVVVYSQGREQFAPMRRYFSSTEDAFRGLPMVTLVNSGSASASEIVGGTLQDWGRSRLLGERTFGKGSVQSLIPINATGWSTKLRLTIARYYLPSGRSIDKVGIEPDVEVSEHVLPPWEAEAIARSDLADRIDAYLQESYTRHVQAFGRLAEGDDGTLDAYPGLRENLGELPPSVTENSVRMMVRVAVRRRVADERGKQFVYDLEEDRVLRRGVYELLGQMGRAAADLPPVYQDIMLEFAGETAARQ